MEEENEAYKIACFSSKNKQTRRIIEVVLWSEDTDLGMPLVTIATDECVQTLSLQETKELFSLIKSLLETVSMS